MLAVEERAGLGQVKWSRLKWSLMKVYEWVERRRGKRDHLQGPGCRLRLPFASADDLVV